MNPSPLTCWVMLFCRIKPAPCNIEHFVGCASVVALLVCLFAFLVWSSYLGCAGWIDSLTSLFHADDGNPLTGECMGSSFGPLAVGMAIPLCFKPRTVLRAFIVSKVKLLSRVWLFVTPWTVAYQAPLSMGFSRQEYWSGLPFPSPGDLPNPGIEPWSPAFRQTLYRMSHQAFRWENVLTAQITMTMWSLTKSKISWSVNSIQKKTVPVKHCWFEMFLLHCSLRHKAR